MVCCVNERIETKPSFWPDGECQYFVAAVIFIITKMRSGDKNTDRNLIAKDFLWVGGWKS